LVVLPGLKCDDNAEVIVPEMAILDIFPPRSRNFLLFHGNIVIRHIKRIILIIDNGG
jgi:hypothetical protein